MKKSLIILCLFLIPLTTAAISIDSSLNSKYNLGDQIQISGYVSQNESFQGILNLILSCQGDSQVGAKYIKPGVETTRAFNFNLFLTSSNVGNCFFKFRLEDMNKNLIEESSSNTFEISKELTSTFTIINNGYASNFQLGDSITFSGQSLNFNQEKINGLATISIKQNGVVYFLDSVAIENGDFTYKTDLVSIPAGEYTVDLYVKDVKGNEQLQEGIIKFNLEDDLIFSTNIDKSSYLPGDLVGLSGEVQRKIGGFVTGEKIKVLMENQEYSADVINGKFLLSIPTSTKIKSHEHNINLTVMDKFGNYGEKSLTFSITPVPTTFDVELDKKSYVPENTILIKSALYDQADDLMSGIIDVKIMDPQGNVVFQDNGATSEEFNYQLPKFAVPGEWNLEALSSGLSNKMSIMVDPVRMTDVSIAGEILTITNLGNELMDEDVNIDGNGIVKTKRVKLQPNETVQIELSKLFKGGIYTMSVLGNEFDDVTILEKGVISRIKGGLNSITGAVAGPSTSSDADKLTMAGMLSLIIIIICAGLVIFYGYNAGRRYYINKKPDHLRRRYDMDIAEGSKKLKELKSTKKKYNFDFGKATEKDTQEFRSRILDSVENTKRTGPGFRKSSEKSIEDGYKVIKAPQEDSVSYSSSSPQRKSGRQGGTFSMFD